MGEPHPFDEDKDLKNIYEMDGYSVAMELSRQRRETGMTFSKEALDRYCQSIAAFVATRVMKHWEETGEPPVHMKTLISVVIDTQYPDKWRLCGNCGEILSPQGFEEPLRYTDAEGSVTCKDGKMHDMQEFPK